MLHQATREGDSDPRRPVIFPRPAARPELSFFSPANSALIPRAQQQDAAEPGDSTNINQQPPAPKQKGRGSLKGTAALSCLAIR